MRPENLALFIPITFLIGLFTAISLRIYYKYKAQVTTANHAPGESVEMWFRVEAMARASVSRSASLRTGGFLTGAGIGALLGIFIGRSPALWQFFGSIDYWGDPDVEFASQITLYWHFILACVIIVGGAGMIATYFLDRAFEGKKRKSNS
jgi:hypothetical protein